MFVLFGAEGSMALPFVLVRPAVGIDLGVEGHHQKGDDRPLSITNCHVSLYLKDGPKPQPPWSLGGKLRGFLAHAASRRSLWRHSRACQPSAKSSSNSSLGHYRNDARTAGNGFATSSSVSKSAKVVLTLQLSFCFEVGALSGSLMSPAPE
jgi:hypothetical protein